MSFVPLSKTTESTKSSYRWDAIIPPLFTLGLCLYTYYKHNYLSSHNDDSTDDKNNKHQERQLHDKHEQDTCLVNSILQEQFENAVQKAQSIPMSSNTPTGQAEKLILYALYKQVHFGTRPDLLPNSAHDVQVPSRFNIVERAKFEAWGKCVGMTKEEAMLRYIAAVEQLYNQHNKTQNMTQEEKDAIENADIVYSDDDHLDEETDLLSSDEENIQSDRRDATPQQSLRAMGMQPVSTLMNDSNDNNNVSNSSNYPLHQAASEGNLPLIQTLLSSRQSKDIDFTISIDMSKRINEQDESGQTPLHLAADRGYFDVITFLVDNGANVNATDHDRTSVILVAVMAMDMDTNLVGNAENMHLKIIQYLLSKGADANLVDEDGESAKTWAESNGNNTIKALFGIK